MKTGMATGLAMAALALGGRALLRGGSGHAPQRPRFLEVPSASEPFPPKRQDPTAEIARAFLMYFVVPLWTAAGTADAACHRASNIETTSGPKESAIHILMLVEVGIP